LFIKKTAEIEGVLLFPQLFRSVKQTISARRFYMIADRATLALHLQRQYVFIAIFLTLKPNPYILN